MVRLMTIECTACSYTDPILVLKNQGLSNKNFYHRNQSNEVNSKGTEKSRFDKHSSLQAFQERIEKIHCTNTLAYQVKASLTKKRIIILVSKAVKCFTSQGLPKEDRKNSLKQHSSLSVQTTPKEERNIIFESKDIKCYTCLGSALLQRTEKIHCTNTLAYQASVSLTQKESIIFVSKATKFFACLSLVLLERAEKIDLKNTLAYLASALQTKKRIIILVSKAVKCFTSQGSVLLKRTEKIP